MDRAWFRPVAEGNDIGRRIAALGALAALVAAGGTLMTPRDDGAVAGREAEYPAASRPYQAPSPGRTGSGGCSAELMTPERAQECARRPVYAVSRDGPPRNVGGVYCAGPAGLAWDWVNGGVLTFLTCDGVRVVAWAFTPSPAAVAAPVASEPEVEVFVTAYYCEQVAGWPLGDGGGYCGSMANGETVHSGAAACGSSWELGTVLDISGGVGRVTCKDRGYLGASQVDVFLRTNADVFGGFPLSTWQTARIVVQ